MLVPRKIPTTTTPLFYVEIVGRRTMAQLMLAYATLSIAIPAFLLFLLHHEGSLAAVFIYDFAGNVFQVACIAWLILAVVAQNEFQRRNFQVGGLSLLWPLTAIPVVFLMLVFGPLATFLAGAALIAGLCINVKMTQEYLRVMKTEPAQRLGCGRHHQIEADE